MEKARLSKFESNNCTKAQHLNSIVARSLVINLEQIQKDHVHQYKNRLTEKNNTENDLASIVYSTENISNKIFDGSRYKNLMKPVEHVSLASIIAEHTSKNISSTTSSDIFGDDLEEEKPQIQYILPPIERQKLRKEFINRYKCNDEMFSKRFDKLEIYKKLKKAPLFEKLKPSDQQKISNTIKNRERQEILQIVDKDKQKIFNPYKDEQIMLQAQVAQFLHKQIENEHLYNGTELPKQ